MSDTNPFLAGLTLHPRQAEFVVTPARFAFYVGGVGAGKTYAGAARAVRYILDQPGSLGLIGAPTYPMLRDATSRTFFELLERVGYAPGWVANPRAEPQEGTYVYNKSEGHLRLPHGTEVLFRSLDEPDRVRGLSLAWFWLDEAALCGYRAWQLLKGRLRQRGYETAGWATGTPRGRDGFYRDFELAPRDGHRLFRAATHANAANLPAHYVDDLGYTGAFYDQEVLGLFTAFAGLVYQLDTTSPVPVGHLRTPAPGQTFARVIGGVDWGYTNPTAAVVFGLDGDGRAWQLAEWYRRGAALEEVVIPALMELTRAYGVEQWWCGPDEPEHIERPARELKREGRMCRVSAAENAVVPGIQTVTKALALRGDGTRGLYVDPAACPHTLAEYASYQYPPAEPEGPAGGMPAGTGTVLSELPLKAADHAMDATRYALHSERRLSERPSAEAYLRDLEARARLARDWRPPTRPWTPPWH